MSVEAPLEGRVALVTGGGSGIGLAIARRLGREGSTVVIAARGEKAEAAQAMVDEENIDGRVVEWDIARFSDYDKRFKELRRAVGGRAISDFVSSAAVLRDGYTHHVSDKNDTLVIKTNQQAPHRIAKRLIPEMRQAKDGTITFISSITGIHGHKLQTNYAQSKAANIALARSLAAEHGPKGIRANAIAPGLVDTEIISKMPERMKREFLDNTISGEPLSADDIAEATLATILDKDMNGQLVVVDDGHTAQTDQAGGDHEYYIPGQGFVVLEVIQTMIEEAKRLRKAATKQ